MAHRQHSSEGAAARGVGEAPASSAPPKPNINAQALQQLVDQAAHFNVFSIPDTELSDAVIHAPGNNDCAIGIKVSEILHRFEVFARAAKGNECFGRGHWQVHTSVDGNTG